MARDAGGQPVAGLAITLQVSGTGNTLTQPAPTDENGFARAVLVSSVAEGKSITASVSGRSLSNAATVTFVPGPASRLSLRVPPSSQVERGVPLPTVVVAVEDQFGNTVPQGGTMTVEAAPIASELSGGLTQNIGEGFATFANLTFSQVGEGITLTFRSGNLTVSSNAISVVPAPPTTNRLVVSASPSGTTVAGDDNLGVISIQLRDRNGLDIAKVGVEISLRVSQGRGTLEGTTRTTTGPTGLATFAGLSLKTAGTYTLTATSTDSDFPNPVTTPSFAIAPDTASPRLLFSEQPQSPVRVGSSFSVQVDITDQFGNRLDGFGETLALSLMNAGSVPSSITLEPLSGLEATPSGGTALFNALRIDGHFESTQNGYFLRAASTVDDSVVVDSASFSLGSGLPARLLLQKSVLSLSVQAASPFTSYPFQLNAQILDRFGNLADNAVNSVTVSLDDGGVTPAEARGVAVLGGTLSKPASGGQVSFDDLTLDKTGDGFALTVSSTGLSPDRSDLFNVTLGDGPRTLVVDNANGKSPADGGNGLPNCPLSSLAEALSEGDIDPDVSVIEIVETGTGYEGNVDLAFSGLTQSIVLRGRQGGRPTLLGRVTLGSGDTVSSLKLGRDAAGATLVGNGLTSGTIDDVVLENPSGSGIGFLGTVGALDLSNLDITTADVALRFSGQTSSVLHLSGCNFTTSAGSGLDLSGGNLRGTGNAVDAMGGAALIANGTNLMTSGVSFTRLASVDSVGSGLNIAGMSGPAGGAGFESQVTNVTDCANTAIAVSSTHVDFNLGDSEVSSAVLALNAAGLDLRAANTGTVTFNQLKCSTNRSGLLLGAMGLRTVGVESTIDAGGGTALLCQGTKFDPAGVTFRTISAQGGASGILLSGTTSGGMTVTGSSGGSPDGSGGKLRSLTGSAVELMNCRNITVRSLDIGAPGSLSNIGNYGVNARTVDTLAIEGCRFSNVGNIGGGEAALFAFNPLGTWTVLNSTFEGSFREHFGIRNNLGTTHPLITVKGCSFSRKFR